VKYGVISTSSLHKDLSSWETLYISGRLQKPHLPLLPPSTLGAALESNKKTALSLALILLGPRFTEYQLWEKIAGISYAGDPRMSIPGAENPEKVRNIVRGEGALEGFRVMYGDLLSAVEWEGREKGEWEWKGDGDEYLIVRTSLSSLIRLMIAIER
jgi:translocator assembly and maintenance protein 41